MGKLVERVLKNNELKPNTASQNNASWYTNRDGSLEHSPSLYYKGPTLQKTGLFLGGPPLYSLVYIFFSLLHINVILNLLPWDLWVFTSQMSGCRGGGAGKVEGFDSGGDSWPRWVWKWPCAWVGEHGSKGGCTCVAVASCGRGSWLPNASSKLLTLELPETDNLGIDTKQQAGFGCSSPKVKSPSVTRYPLLTNVTLMNSFKKGHHMQRALQDNNVRILNKRNTYIFLHFGGKT